MPIDVNNFISPEQNFGGLYKLTNDIERRKAMQQQAAKEAESQKAASTKFLINYLDDKDKFTGTKYDPNIHEYVSTALNQGMDLIRQGADINDIMTAITPIVNKANSYSNNAQMYSQNKKQALDRLKNIPGIDVQKVADEMDRQAFEGKDLSQVDPSLPYADMALKNGDVYSNEGFGALTKGRPMNTDKGRMKFTNARKGMESSMVELTAPNFAVSEKDKEGNHIAFVPKYEVATDAGEPILHQFQTDKGMETAPVRLLAQDEFDKIMNSKDTGAKGYILQEVRKFAKEHNVQLNSTQAENLGRAIAYDEMKPLAAGTYKHYQEEKANPIIIKNYNGASKSEQAAALTKNDLYTALDETTPKGGLLDITPLTGGIKFLVNSRGKQISQPHILFNPTDKTITFSDPIGEDKEPETVSLSKFKSMAKSNNSKEDLNYLEFLRNYNKSANAVPEPAPIQEKKNAISRLIEWSKNKLKNPVQRSIVPTKEVKKALVFPQGQTKF